MPAIAKKTDTAGRSQALVDQLSAILRQRDPSQGEPLIVENPIAQTRNVHLVVIWDEWTELSPAARSKVIVVAYAKAKRLQKSTITAAMGLTNEEAFRMGFLPYSIVTTRRPADKASRDQLARAMAGADGILVTVGSSTQLRFATLEQAEDAYRHLSQQVPGPYWAIVQERGSTE